MAANVTDARISNKGRVELQISVPATDVASVLGECENELARKGGIIPDGKRETLVARYGEERLNKLTDAWIMDRFGTETLAASENPLVGFPRFYLVENGYPEGPFVFQAVSYELPHGELSSVKPVEVGPEARVPSEESVDKAMKSLVRAYTAQRVTDENRPIEFGDTVKVDIEVSAGGVRVESFTKRATSLKVDYTTMPRSFIDHVVGMRPGEEKEFSFTVPAIGDICDEERFDAKVAVIALYYVDEPKLTQKWIEGKFPGMKTADDLRNAMAQSLVQRAGGVPSMEDAIDAALFERLTVEIPDELVDFVAAGVERAECESMHAQGLGLQEFCEANDTTPEKWRARLHQMVMRDVKLSVALDELYTAKGFTLTEGDLDRFFEQMAPGLGAEMKYGYTMSGRLPLAEEMAQRAKIRRWLAETATVAQ